MRALGLLCALALAACAAPPRDLPPPNLPTRAGTDAIVAARAEGVAFRGVGGAQDFLLHIYREDRIVLSWDRGAHRETFPKPLPTMPSRNGDIYETHNSAHALRIEIQHTPCNEVMAGAEVFPDTVLVVIDGEERRGCGRAL